MVLSGDDSNLQATLQRSDAAISQTTSTGAANLNQLNRAFTDLAQVAVPGFSQAIALGNQTISTLQSGASGAVSALTGMSAAFGAVGVATAALSFRSFDDGIQKLYTLSQITGMSTQQVQGLLSAFESVGAPTERATFMVGQFQLRLQNLQQAMDAGRAATTPIARALDELGVSAVGVDGKVRPMAELMPLIEQAFARAKVAVDAHASSLNLAGLSEELFGRSAAQILPVLEQGTTVTDRYTQAAQQAGIGTQHVIDTWLLWQKTSADLHLQLSGLGQGLGTDVAPALTTVAGGAAAALGAINQLPGPIRDIAITFPLAAAGATALGAAIAIVGKESYATLGPIGLVIGAGITLAEIGHELADRFNSSTKEIQNFGTAQATADEQVGSFTNALREQGVAVGDLAGKVQDQYQAAMRGYAAATQAVENYLQQLGKEQPGHEINTQALYKQDAAFRQLIDGENSARATAAAWTTQLQATTTETDSATASQEKLNKEWQAALGPARQIETTGAAYAELQRMITATGNSSQAAAAFEQEYAQAIAISAEAGEGYKASLETLNSVKKDGSDTDKQTATNILNLIDMLKHGVTPAMIEAAQATEQQKQHQKDLNDAWSQASAAGPVEMLRDLDKELQDASVSAGTLLQHMTDLFSKPTQEQLTLRAQIADLDAQLGDFQAKLANSAPALQAVANYQKVYDQLRLTGGSSDQLTKAQQDLQAAIAATASIGGREVASEQEQADGLQRTRDGLSAKEKALGTANAATLAHAQANSGTALTEADLARAADGTTQALTNQTRTVQAVPSANATMDAANRTSAGTFDTLATAISGAAGALSRFGQLVQGSQGLSAAGFNLPGMTGVGPPGLGAAGQVAGGVVNGPFAGAYPVTQGFGPSNEPLEPAYGGYPHFHQGVDYGVPSGTPLQAVAAGTVKLAGMDAGYGNAVVLDLGNGVQVLYGHLSDVGVSVGQQVAPGQQIGLSGNTGASTGPHLHFEVDVNGQPVDPATLSALLGTGPAPGPAAGSAAQQITGWSTQYAAAHGLDPQQLAAMEVAINQYEAGGSTQNPFQFMNDLAAQHGQGGTPAEQLDILAGMGRVDAAYQAWVAAGGGPAGLRAAENKQEIPGDQNIAARGQQALSDASAAGASAAGQVVGSPFGAAYVAPSTQGALPTPGQQAKDLASVDQQLASITTKYQDLEGTLRALQQVGVPPTLSGQLAAAATAVAPLAADYEKVRAAAVAYEQAVASGSVGTKELQDLRDALTAANDQWGLDSQAADRALTQISTAQTALADQTKALTTDQQRQAEVTTGRIKQDKDAVTQAVVESDQQIAASAQQTSTAALQSATQWHQRVIDDIQQNVTPAQIAADEAAAKNAEQAAQAWYDYWHNAQQREESDLKVLTDNAASSLKDLAGAVEGALKNEDQARLQQQTDAINQEKTNDQNYHDTLVQSWRDGTTQFTQELDNRTRAQQEAIDAQSKASQASLTAEEARRLAPLYVKADQTITAAMGEADPSVMAQRLQQENVLQGKISSATVDQKKTLQSQLTQMQEEDITASYEKQKKAVTDRAELDKKALADHATVVKQNAQDDLTQRIQVENAYEKALLGSLDARLTAAKRSYADETTALALQAEARLLIESGNQKQIAALLAAWNPEAALTGTNVGADILSGKATQTPAQYVNTVFGLLNAAQSVGTHPVGAVPAGGGGLAPMSAAAREAKETPIILNLVLQADGHTLTELVGKRVTSGQLMSVPLGGGLGGGL